MAKKYLEARDCSPFYEVCKEKGTVRKTFVKPVDPQLKVTELRDYVQKESALQTLSDIFFEANEKAIENGEYVVLLRTGFYHETGEGKNLQTLWCAGRYIGLANIGDIQISIRPRFGEGFLLKVLEDVYNFKYSKNNSDIIQSFSNDWFSSILNILQKKIWMDRCAIANRYGLPRKCVKRIHKGTVLRGAIDVRRTIMPWLKQKEIVSTTFEREFDERICRIVYEAHRILSRNVTKKKEKGSRIESSNSEIPQIVKDTINALNNEYKGTIFNITETDYRRINYKSIYASWKPLVDFSWEIIQNRNRSMRSAEHVSECVFVDMAEIWEAFLRKKLGEGLKNNGWRMWPVEECEQYVYSNSFFGRKIIPDIVLQRNVEGKEQFIVFDAKYKRMRGDKFDVDRTDFFQIHTYIQYFQHTYPQGEVLLGGLLYPITAEEEKIIKGHNLFGKDNGISRINVSSMKYN